MFSSIKDYPKYNELLKLYDLPLEELIELASNLTKKNFDNNVEFCSIISAKTGKCGENCKYCAQSSHYRTDIDSHSLITVDEVKKAALNAKETGVTKFSIVTSGREPDQNDFDHMVEMIEAIESIDNLSACASLGFLNKEQTKKLKDAGLKRYHHNINTCSSFHDEICTTHSFEDRIKTIKTVQEEGIDICCGVIIGMGETREQRIEMALELAEINPVSVPVNFLSPIEGTPFENHWDKISEEEILRTLAIFRIALPKVFIRYAGGRMARFSKESQKAGLKAGVNGMLVGNYLTTIGISPEEDIELVTNCGMNVAK